MGGPLAYRVVVRGLILVLLAVGCHLPDTNAGPDANQSVRFQLGLTTRYQDPASALSGLSIWVDGENRVIGEGPVVQLEFSDMGQAAESVHTLEVRYGSQLLHEVEQRPGQVCASEHGDNNQLVAETVNLCVRSNGEIQLNDFSCEYQRSGFFTADVFCPTDCHPLLGARTCTENRCGLVLSNQQPRFGRLACVPAGGVAQDGGCRPPQVGVPDSCQAGLACVAGACRSFCLSSADCPSPLRCESALSNDAEPRICIDPSALSQLDLSQP